jgi:hypothetical protein
MFFNAPRVIPATPEVLMEPTNRRTFLRNTGIAVAAAGAASVVPTAAGALQDDHPPVPDDERADIAVVAHVRNVRKGEVVLYTGEQEVVVKNKRLAALLYHASR